MNKIAFLIIGSVALLIQSVSGQVFYTTTNDFTGWDQGDTNFNAFPTNSPDLDGDVTNGLGDLTDPGSVGTGGSLALSWTNGAYEYIYGPDQSANRPFLTALEGATNLTLKCTSPASSSASGTYFELGIVLNFTGNFQQIFPTSSVTTNGVTTETFSGPSFTNAVYALYTQDVVDDSLGYFQLGLIYNSNYEPTNPFNVDAIEIPVPLPPSPPPPPPTLSIQKVAAPGLTLFASAGGNARQNIETLDSYPWYGDTGLQAYSLTITNFPGTNYANDFPALGFQAQIFLVDGIPGTESAPDYNEATVMFLQIQGNTTNSGGMATLWYKTNDPNAYPYEGNVLAQWSSPNILGTWTVAFTNNTNAILTAPNGTSTNFSISPAIVSQFSDDNLYVYYGIQPNNNNEVSQSATFSKVQITNSSSGVLLSDQFTTVPLNPALWETEAGLWPANDTNAIIVATNSAAYWLSWNYPAGTFPNSGYNVVDSTSLKPPITWSSPGLTTYPGDDLTRVVVYTNNLPSNTNGFYILKN
jgi:hypothetical protein